MSLLSELSYFCEITLRNQSPVLSGNMQKGIRESNIGRDEITIVIDAPFYDMKEWEKNHRIVHTGKKYGTITDYAMWVNKLGAFGTGNSSKGWVNRALWEAIEHVASKYGAEPIYDLKE